MGHNEPTTKTRTNEAIERPGKNENRARRAKEREDELKWGIMQRQQAKAYDAKLKEEQAQRSRKRNEEKFVQDQYKQEWDGIKQNAKQN